MAYDWPGNVRELQNAIKSSAVMAGRIIEAVHLPSFITQSWHYDRSLDAETINTLSPQSLDQRVQLIEKQLIIQALTQSRGVQKHAARLLGIKERSLWHRLKKYEIDASSFKAR
jgi:DNA-binding NtrC family response regulator